MTVVLVAVDVVVVNDDIESSVDIADSLLLVRIGTVSSSSSVPKSKVTPFFWALLRRRSRLAQNFDDDVEPFVCRRCVTMNAASVPNTKLWWEKHICGVIITVINMIITVDVNIRRIR